MPQARTFGAVPVDGPLLGLCVAGRLEPGPGVDELEQLVAYTARAACRRTPTRGRRRRAAAPRVWTIGGRPLPRRPRRPTGVPVTDLEGSNRWLNPHAADPHRRVSLRSARPRRAGLTELACVANHIELTPDTSVTTLDTMCGSKDYPGVMKWSLIATLYQSFDPDATEEVLSRRRRARRAGPVRDRRRTSRQPVSATNPKWTGIVIPQPYAPINGDAGDASTIELEWALTAGRSSRSPPVAMDARGAAAEAPAGEASRDAPSGAEVRVAAWTSSPPRRRARPQHRRGGRPRVRAASPTRSPTTASSVPRRTGRAGRRPPRAHDRRRRDGRRWAQGVEYAAYVEYGGRGRPYARAATTSTRRRGRRAVLVRGRRAGGRRSDRRDHGRTRANPRARPSMPDALTYRGRDQHPVHPERAARAEGRHGPVDDASCCGPDADDADRMQTIAWLRIRRDGKAVSVGRVRRRRARDRPWRRRTLRAASPRRARRFCRFWRMTPRDVDQLTDERVRGDGPLRRTVR